MSRSRQQSGVSGRSHAGMCNRVVIAGRQRSSGMLRCGKRMGLNTSLGDTMQLQLQVLALLLAGQHGEPEAPQCVQAMMELLSCDENPPGSLALSWRARRCSAAASPGRAA